MDSYNKLFFFVLRLRRIGELLKKVWRCTNSASLRRSEPVVYREVR